MQFPKPEGYEADPEVEVIFGGDGDKENNDNQDQVQMTKKKPVLLKVPSKWRKVNTAEWSGRSCRPYLQPRLSVSFL